MKEDLVKKACKMLKEEGVLVDEEEVIKRWKKLKPAVDSLLEDLNAVIKKQRKPGGYLNQLSDEMFIDAIESLGISLVEQAKRKRIVFSFISSDECFDDPYRFLELLEAVT